MTIFLFANQAQTTLALPVAPTDTTLYVAAGTGRYFPQPEAGQVFTLTLINAVNNLVNEIVYVTSVSGDAFTVERGQEGTPAQAWNQGDFATNLDTAGTSDNFVQPDQLLTGDLSAYFNNMEAKTGQVNATPVNATDIVNKSYVDNLALGLSPKVECQCATTTIVQGGGNITLSGLQTIDGYTTVAGDRVLVKNEDNPALNGIYIASTGDWLRAPDMDTWSQVPGAFTFIVNGNDNYNTGWVAIVPETGFINATPINWTQLTGVGNSGYSGYSGFSGYSGYSGSGTSGYSGESGYSGFSGISGWSGWSGYWAI